MVPLSRQQDCVRPLDRIVVQTDLVTVGAFRCETGHPLFRDSGPIRQSCFVFPRTAVTIAHAERRPFIADPTVVTLYNRGQRYERVAVSPLGDRCDWFGVSDGVWRDATRPFDPQAADDEMRPVRFEQAGCDADLYLRQRQLMVSLGRTPADLVRVEETVMCLLARVLARAYRSRAAARTARSSEASSRRADLVDAARRLMARRFAERLTLSRLASALGCSPFHLCRSFRAVTGVTLHRHLTELRLRSALERVDAGADLAGVAFDVGFSSHSHFTAAFRSTFGVAPSEARARTELRSELRPARRRARNR